MLRTTGVEPWARILSCAIALGAREGAGRLADIGRTADTKERNRRARRTAAAARVASTLGRLKGVFTKAGQFASLRYDVLPPAAQEIVASLRDRVPPLPFPVIRSTVEEALGASLADRFAHFEPLSIGAASVAQVHRARLHDGREVAVKVQYPWIADSRTQDLAIARRLLAIWDRASGARSVDRSRVFEEFAEGLEAELDFEREAAVADEIAANLAGDPQVVVPEIVHSHTTRRVLTMSYHPTLRLSRDALAARSIEAGAVLEIIARAYAKQVFVDGLFHADPHTGNLFVLDEPGATEQPRVLFVDFGLSKRLDPSLRREMRLGIYALLQRDLDTFVDRMQAMAMIAPGAEPGVRAAVAQMFDRIASQGGGAGALGLSGAGVLGLKDEAKRLLQETPGLQLPNDLLLYAKTLSYLFALGAELDPEVDLLGLSTPYLLQFLAGRD